MSLKHNQTSGRLGSVALLDEISWVWRVYMAIRGIRHVLHPHFPPFYQDSFFSQSGTEVPGL